MGLSKVAIWTDGTITTVAVDGVDVVPDGFHLGEAEQVGKLLVVMRGFFRRVLPGLLGGFERGFAGLAGVLSESGGEQGVFALLYAVAAGLPFLEGVEGEIAVVGVQEAGKLLAGEAVGKGGVVDNPAVCHGGILSSLWPVVFERNKRQHRIPAPPCVI